MKKILVIDDELDFVGRLKKSLEISGFQVFSAFNGQEGLDLAKKERPQLILLDIMMPGIDGFEVLKKLRNSVETSLTNVIMITARGDSSAILKAIDSYATDYIIKPFELSRLMDMIKKYA